MLSLKEYSSMFIISFNRLYRIIYEKNFFILILSCVFMVFSCSDRDIENSFDAVKLQKNKISANSIKLGVKSVGNPIELLYSQEYLIEKFNELNRNYSLIISDIIDDSLEERPSLLFYGYDKVGHNYMTFGFSLVKIEDENGNTEYYLDPNDIGDPNIAYVAGGGHTLILTIWCEAKNGCERCEGPYYNQGKLDYDCKKCNTTGSGSCVLKKSITTAPKVNISSFLYY